MSAVIEDSEGYAEMFARPLTTIRASALGDFLDCAARAEAKHLLGLRMPSGQPSVLGSALHASTAVYDRSVLEKQGLTVEEAAGAAVDILQHPKDEVRATPEDMPAKLLEQVARTLHKRYCLEIAPKMDYAAIEVRCERLELTDVGIALTGTTDRVLKVKGGYSIADIKSGKRAVSAAGTIDPGPHLYQLGVYELLAAHASDLPIGGGARIIGIQTGKTERGQRVAVSDPLEGARAALIGDADSPGVLESVGRMIEHGDFPGNPKSFMCSQKYCPIHSTCKYRR
jgi:hypothetical protein